MEARARDFGVGAFLLAGIAAVAVLSISVGGATYRGPGGVSLTEPSGTTLDVDCKLTGYKPGSVRLVFDGVTETVLCTLTRIKTCITDIKNPFDECPDPVAPPP